MEDKIKKSTEEDLVNNYASDGSLINPLDSAAEDTDETIDNDKYLAMEQPGVTFTHDTNPTLSSDTRPYKGNKDPDETWNDVGGNSRNSDAFNQDDYLLDDNVDLDEDQNQSLSSDDEDFEESNERYTN